MIRYFINKGLRIDSYMMRRAIIRRLPEIVELFFNAPKIGAWAPVKSPEQFSIIRYEAFQGLMEAAAFSQSLTLVTILKQHYRYWSGDFVEHYALNPNTIRRIMSIKHTIEMIDLLKDCIPHHHIINVPE